MATDQPLLILGIGNRILSDDGIGIKLIEDLQDEFRHPLVHFKTACTGGLEIVEMMQNYKDVLIFDAIKTPDGHPGKIYHFSVEDFKETLHISSFHDISFLIALEFMKRSGLGVPENIRILAVEIVEDSYFSEDFSGEIQKQYKTIRNKVRSFVRKNLDEKFVQVAEKVDG
jgi:hydrogenase maturation protease